MGELDPGRAARVLDVSGLVVAPGFIDAHSHALSGLRDPERREAHALLHQGVTTVVLNPDGGGPHDLAALGAELEAGGIGVHAALLVPYGSVRVAVLGEEARAPSAAELARMRSLVRAGMQAGGFGLSTGLFYAPQSAACTSEVLACARVVGEFGGVYHSHLRDESDYGIGLLAAVDELIEISRGSGLTGVISHVKCLGPPTWGLSREVVARVEAARSQGVDVYADQYPYVASSTSLAAALVPRWAQDGGREALLLRLEDSETRVRVKIEMVRNLLRRGGAARIVLTGGVEVGQSLAEVAVERGLSAIDAALELIAAGSPGIVSFNMTKEDLRTFMTQPWTMTSSDGGLPRFGEGAPHPRSYGSFPRKLARFARDLDWLSLEAAVRSSSGLTAEVFGFSGRGRLEEGAWGDVVVLDLESLVDRATYETPHAFSEGVRHVLLEGRLALQDGLPTGLLGGRVLRKVN